MTFDNGCIVEPQIVTQCMICDEEIPVYGYDHYPRICESCRKSIMEVKVVLSELKKMAAGGQTNEV